MCIYSNVCVYELICCLLEYPPSLPDVCLGDPVTRGQHPFPLHWLTSVSSSWSSILRGRLLLRACGRLRSLPFFLSFNSPSPLAPAPWQPATGCCLCELWKVTQHTGSSYYAASTATYAANQRMCFRFVDSRLRGTV